jgi:tetratricopeptide (TPR) repeat protein
MHYLRYHPGTDFRRVLSLPTREAVLLAGQEGYAFQSASWLLVFYLANERPSELDDYIARLARREESQTAFNAAFRGLDAETLGAEVERYFQSLRQDVQEAEAAVRYRLRYAPDAPVAVDVQVRKVPLADVQALRAELLFLSPGLPRSRAHLVESRRMLEEALRLDPSHPLALAVQLALPESANAAAPLERIRDAAAARPADYRSQMLLAFAVGPGQPEARRAALARAVELAPENPTVLNALAWHDVTHGRAAEAIPVATKAAGLAPTRAAVLDTLATALARSSRCEEAVRVEERAVELTAEHASSALRRKLLARLDAMRAGCANIPLDEE